MSQQIPIKKYVEDVLRASKLAVLATERDGQPHASLIAITSVGGFRQLVFLTYRKTRKFENLAHNDKVAILIQGEDIYASGQQKSFALTAFGNAHESLISEHDDILHKHLEKHPDLAGFIQNKDYALVLVTVMSYQLVQGINDVTWFSVSDLEKSPSFVTL
jgi:nitroimidazol reductase NimA-like FMN-containing flavoprotein (pyridoxamine 5'-phosphate oxidase superfamily)